MRHPHAGAFGLLCAFAVLAPLALARQADTAFTGGLRWRPIGPNRAGRVSAVAGVPGDPTVYYIGTPDGGLWKTTDAGTTWQPIFDAVHVPSIGAVAVAPSDAHVVYVGTGHNLIGQGVYRSADAGATWRAAGLGDTKYITALVVDPRDPNVVLAGVGSGGNFGSMVFYNNGPSAARGVYRTTNGGGTWTHVLTVDPGSGVVDLVRDPNDARHLYVTFSGSGGGGGGRGRGAGAAGGAAVGGGAPGRAAGGAAPPGSTPSVGGPEICQSADGGATWARLNAQGFMSGVAAANLTVAPGTATHRLYALVGGRGGGGLYRSDDAGATWTLGTNRLASASGHIYADPHNPEVLYTMGTSMYRSTDGGRTLAAFKGAPGGDDNRSLWIDPTNPRRMIIGADQGPTITVNGGATWTPWYVVQNGEHYFVTTDDQFPYWVYAAQQDSGTVAIKSRSDYGAIRPNDWYPVSGYEQGHIFADPFNPRYVYSHGGGHTVLRFDRETGQVGPIFTPRDQDRFGPRPGMALSPKDPHRLFVGAQYVLETDDRGVTWKTISPDLTGGNGTIVAVAPSPLDAGLLWVASSSGLIHVTRDGGQNWKDVSPTDTASNATMALWSMEASGHDAGVAYAAAIDLSDQHGPRLFRTTDFGEHWQSIVTGLPPNVPARVVREDPERPSLLYAGTQAGAWVSFDRGDHWQPLQLNLPTVAVNDLAVHGADLVAATWGRGLWILDDVTPLRQIDAARASATPVFLFEPAPVTRARWDVNQDTPLPPEVPTGQNPPDGAIFDYYLREPAAGPVTLTIRSTAGQVVREYSSTATAPDSSMPNVPMYWFLPADAERLAVAAGAHRVVWDLRYATPPALDYGPDGEPATSVSYGIIATAIVGESPRRQPVGPLVVPGTYQVQLTVNGQSSTRPLVVMPDPRVPVSAADFDAALGWQLSLTTGSRASHDAIESLRALRQLAHDRVAAARTTPELTAALAAFDRAVLSGIGGLSGGRTLASHLAALEFADMAPNDNTVGVLQDACAKTSAALARYRQAIDEALPALNSVLTTSGATAIPKPTGDVGPGCGR
jgi:photosystem II stability/assembly factor-like uncharacterized protein